MQWKQQRESSKKKKNNRQLSGQSTGLTIFMKVSDTHKSSSSKKAVSLNMLERTDGKIDKLTSLDSKMNVKIRKHDTQLKPQMFLKKTRRQNGCYYIQNDYWAKIDHLVEIEIHHTKVEEDSIGIIQKL